MLVWWVMSVMRGHESGVSDHYATDDWHALDITRSIVAGLNARPAPPPPVRTDGPTARYHKEESKHSQKASRHTEGGSAPSVFLPACAAVWCKQVCVEEPLLDPLELGGLIPCDTKKPFDVRNVIAR